MFIISYICLGRLRCEEELVDDDGQRDHGDDGEGLLRSAQIRAYDDRDNA